MDARTYVLIPGSGGQAWYWHRLVESLKARGHDVIAVGLPAADDSAGLPAYVDAAIESIDDRRNLVVVGQSMGAYTASMLCERVPVDLLVLLNAMIPAPGETPGEWWGNVGHAQAQADHAAREGRDAGREFDMMEMFFHDIPPDVTEWAMAQGEPVQSDTPFRDRWPLSSWPDVPTRVLQGRDDRLFPVEFQRSLAIDRLDLVIDEMPGGHLLALSQPEELAERLEGYHAELCG